MTYCRYKIHCFKLTSIDGEKDKSSCLRKYSSLYLINRQSINRNDSSYNLEYFWTFVSDSCNQSDSRWHEGGLRDLWYEHVLFQISVAWVRVTTLIRRIPALGNVWCREFQYPGDKRSNILLCLCLSTRTDNRPYGIRKATKSHPSTWSPNYIQSEPSVGSYPIPPAERASSIDAGLSAFNLSRW